MHLRWWGSLWTVRVAAYCVSVNMPGEGRCFTPQLKPQSPSLLPRDGEGSNVHGKEIWTSSMGCLNLHPSRIPVEGRRHTFRRRGAREGTVPWKLARAATLFLLLLLILSRWLVPEFGRLPVIGIPWDRAFASLNLSNKADRKVVVVMQQRARSQQASRDERRLRTRQESTHLF